MGNRKSESDAEMLAVAGELRVIIGKLTRKLREHARPGGLSSSQISAIGRLYREGSTTVTVLARADGMRPQSMGAIVAELTAAGLVTGAPDPADGRQTILSLTDAARAMIELNRAKRDDWLFHAIQTRLEPGEQENLAAAVALLSRLVD